jgi:hypothetical protein
VGVLESLANAIPVQAGDCGEPIQVRFQWVHTLREFRGTAKKILPLPEFTENVCWEIFKKSAVFPFFSRQFADRAAPGGNGMRKLRVITDNVIAMMEKVVYEIATRWVQHGHALAKAITENKGGTVRGQMIERVQLAEHPLSTACLDAFNFERMTIEKRGSFVAAQHGNGDLEVGPLRALRDPEEKARGPRLNGQELDRELHGHVTVAEAEAAGTCRRSSSARGTQSRRPVESPTDRSD